MKLINISKKQIKETKIVTDYAKQWAFKNWHYLTEVNTPLLNIDSSRKLKKGKQFKTAILYLKPSDKIATKTLCPSAKLYGCEKDCLESSGQLGMSVADNAKIKRTIIYLLNRKEFVQQIKSDIEKYYKKYGDLLAVRLNGTSDIDFSFIIEEYPHIQFYDYTKIYYRLMKNDLKNYDLTFSGSGANHITIKHTARAIKEGQKTVLAINTAETIGEYKRPKKLDLIPLIDMDKTDYRFTDPINSVGTLKRKGSNKAERKQAEINKYDFFFTQSTLKELSTHIKGGKNV